MWCSTCRCAMPYIYCSIEHIAHWLVAQHVFIFLCVHQYIYIPKNEVNSRNTRLRIMRASCNNARSALSKTFDNWSRARNVFWTVCARRMLLSLYTLKWYIHMWCICFCLHDVCFHKHSKRADVCLCLKPIRSANETPFRRGAALRMPWAAVRCVVRACQHN